MGVQQEAKTSPASLTYEQNLRTTAGSLSLREAAIVVGDEPRYVQRAVEDLEGELRRGPGPPLARYRDLETALRSRQEPLILVGSDAAEQLKRHGLEILLEDLGREGFVVQHVTLTQPKKEIVIVAGHDPHGTNYAVLELYRQVSVAPSRDNIPWGLDEREKPVYNLRGIYAHPAWVYNRPFGLRAWTLDDWKRYVDLMAYLRLNLFQFWPLIEIIPDPLSPGDQKYLAMFNEVVRYARDERGLLEVWPGNCANNIARTD